MTRVRRKHRLHSLMAKTGQVLLAGTTRKPRRPRTCYRDTHRAARNGYEIGLTGLKSGSPFAIGSGRVGLASHFRLWASHRGSKANGERIANKERVGHVACPLL